MQTNVIYRIFLIVGSIFLYCNCAKPTIEWGGKDEFVYVNQTEYTLQFDAIINSHDSIFVIQPQTSETFIIKWFGQEKIELVVLDDLNIPLKPQFCINDTCIVVEQRSFMIGANYQAESLGDRHRHFTYTFTNDEIDELLR